MNNGINICNREMKLGWMLPQVQTSSTNHIKAKCFMGSMKPMKRNNIYHIQNVPKVSALQVILKLEETMHTTTHKLLTSNKIQISKRNSL